MAVLRGPGLLALLLIAAGRQAAFPSASESWIELRSPNFLVVTNAKDKAARRVACQFEMIRAVFHLPALEVLFRVNASSPYYREDNKACVFHAESWVVTHYLIIRDWLEHTHRVSDFVALLDKEGTPRRPRGARSAI